MHYYQHNIKDFNNATRHLTHVERVLYRDSIELYYDTEQPLTSVLSVLFRRLRAVTDDEKAAVEYVLSEFFYLVDGVYRHDRCDSEIEKYHSNSSAKARAGKASADSRRKKKEAAIEHNLTGVEQALNTCTTREQQTKNQEPITINQLKDKTLSAKPDPATRIFDYWVGVMDKNTETTKLTPKRGKAIKARLKIYSEDQIKTAIDNCRADSWSMGHNDRQTPFNDIELICRSGEKLESFISKVQMSGSSLKVDKNINVTERWLQGAV